MPPIVLESDMIALSTRWSLDPDWAEAQPGSWIQRPVAALADSLPWPSADAINRRAREAVAREWGENPDHIYLEWGTVRDTWEPPEHTEVQLLGTGSDGHWVALLVDPNDPDGGTQVRIRAGVEIPQALASRPLKRGERLRAGDIRWETGIHWGRSKDVNFQVRPGWQTRTNIREGQVLRPPLVAPAHSVVSGRQVDVVWRRNGVSIRLKGRAQGSAAPGENVYVRTDTGQRLKGVAQTDGTVLVAPSSPGGTR